MCGIVGCIDRFDRVEERTILQMSSQIFHRGPDDVGIYAKNNIGIGMRRLSIIDVNGGHQPISNEDETIRIVFNGEIYNYKELKGELIKDGHSFKTRTDTEVIIHLYEKYGEKCIEKLNGMFAFAVFDEKKQKVFIARDRLGIKPLYYFFDDKKMVFASEIKSLLVDKFIVKEISQNAIWDYLTFRYIPEPDTIWKGIKKLPPAHWLQFDITTWNLKIDRYWDIPFKRDSEKSQHKTDRDYLDEFSLLFEDSVSRHLQSDVPVGILLSGGLDSSAVLSAVKRVHNDDIYSFSVGFDDGGEFSELEYAREAAKYLGAINHEIVIGHKEFTDFLSDFVWYTDEPLADLASVPLYYVSKLASSHVKVVLSGEGSDEILAGYDLEHVFLKYEKSRRFRYFPRWFKKTFVKNMYGVEASADYYNLPFENQFHMTNIFSSVLKQELFETDFGYNDSMSIVRNYYKHLKGAHPLNQILYAFSQSWLVEDLLMKADKMTMANSLELRVPFLDYRLVEWAAQLPVHLKIGDYNQAIATKKILRMYSENKIPASILNRPKKGFPVPAYKWLSSELKGFVFDMINNKSCLIEYFDSRVLENISTTGTSVDADLIDQHKLWSLLILEIWMRRWLKK